MPSRDQRLAATKYAGRKSASQAAQEKTSRRASTPQVAEDPMDAMRRALAQPRSQESIDRARAHQRNLPPLG